MTVDEIKFQISMDDVLQMYGLKKARGGMCSCPFHGRDKHPSMKIYKDSFNCFTCHANGDIFSFVMKMDGCDFKTAFYKLGGSYKKNKTFSDRRKLSAIKTQKTEKQLQLEKDKKRLKLIGMLIGSYKRSIEREEEGSAEWHRLLCRLEMLFDEQAELIRRVI